MNNEFQRRFAMVEKQRKKMMEDYGWVVDFVFPTNQNELANIHTHGVKDTFGHTDFQIVLPLQQQLAHRLLIDLVERVKRGEQIVPEKRYNDVIHNFDVYFVKKYEGTRIVLRMILPDDQGKYPGENGCKPIYNEQLTWDTRH